MTSDADRKEAAAQDLKFWDNCPAGWGPPQTRPCPESYTHGHYCVRQIGHTGMHRCACGYATSRKDAMPTKAAK